MPRVELPLTESTSDYDLALWKMEESEAELYGKYPELEANHSLVDGFKSAVRRQEALSVRALLQELTGKMPVLSHNANGKPLLDDGRNISITHTKGYAAVIISRRYNVAIDIEYMSDRVCRIAERFLRDDEMADSTLKKLLCWCTKETLYKLHSEDELAFSDMRVISLPDTISLEKPNTLLIENLKRKQVVRVDAIVTESYALAYAVERQ